MRLSPRDPQAAYFLGGKAIANFIVGNLEAAVSFMDMALQHRPDFPGGLRLKSSALAHLGRLDDARLTMKIYQELLPQLTLANIEATSAFVTDDSRKYFIDGLSLAGLK